jgi:hypothetical protein
LNAVQTGSGGYGLEGGLQGLIWRVLRVVRTVGRRRRLVVLGEGWLSSRVRRDRVRRDRIDGGQDGGEAAAGVNGRREVIDESEIRSVDLDDLVSICRWAQSVGEVLDKGDVGLVIRVA